MSVSEVSAFEPQPLAAPKLDMPEFQVVRRAEQALYRLRLEAKGTPSFSHLGSHAAGIIEEAGRSAEKLLLDAAERAQEAIDQAEAEAAEAFRVQTDRD